MRTRVQLCGRLVAEFAGEPIEQRLPGRQGRLLFGYLATNRTRWVSRDELIDALWGETIPRGVNASLSALLSRLRDAAGSASIEGRSELRLLLGDDAVVDVEQAMEAVHRAESAIALGRWSDAWAPALGARFITARPFLSGLQAVWVDDRRRQLEDVHLRALQAYAAASLAVGGPELPAAERTAAELVRQAPLREAGYRLMMEAKSASGNTAEALRVYDQLVVVLREELGASPSPESKHVYERLLQTS